MDDLPGFDPSSWDSPEDGMVFLGRWYPWSTWFEGYQRGDYRKHDYRRQFWGENQKMGGWSEDEFLEAEGAL